jgi:hypothetical protein
MRASFVRAPIQEDREPQAEAKLEIMLIDGVRSGEAEEANGIYWETLKDEIREVAVQTSDDKRPDHPSQFSTANPSTR